MLSPALRPRRFRPLGDFFGFFGALERATFLASTQKKYSSTSPAPGPNLSAPLVPKLRLEMPFPEAPLQLRLTSSRRNPSRASADCRLELTRSSQPAATRKRPTFLGSTQKNSTRPIGDGKRNPPDQKCHPFFWQISLKSFQHKMLHREKGRFQLERAGLFWYAAAVRRIFRTASFWCGASAL